MGEKKLVYVDNNATTRVDEEVVHAMQPYFTGLYGNPSSIHSFGGQIAKKIADARGQVAELLGAQDTEIVFTSGGTESDNFAIKGVLEYFPDKKHIVTTKVEHHAVLSLCDKLAKEGYQVTKLSVDRKGNLDLNELRNSLRDDTAIVSIMYANNETGVIFPVEKIGQIVKERGITFHVDGVQAVGKIPINLKDSPIDLLSLSSHKYHGPKGIGALYIKRGTRIKPMIVGGHHERGRRAGTENVPGIIGLAKACELAQKYMQDELTRIKGMRDRLEEKILARFKNALVNGDRENRTPNTTNISFEYVEGEAILLYLDERGIAASSGSACTSGSLEPSHVLRAMGVPFTAAHGSVRFSLSRFNTDEDVDYILSELPPIIERLLEISPFGREVL
jgi:cysteine desulfurase